MKIIALQVKLSNTKFPDKCMLNQSVSSLVNVATMPEEIS